MKRFATLTLVLLSLFFIVSFAEESNPLEIDSRAAIVYNSDNKKILYSKDAESIVYPASLAKIMTGLLACEYYNSRGGDFIVTISENAANAPGTTVGLREGEQISFYDLIAAMMAGGGNDAALAIAETVGGSVEGFVDMMNRRAQDLGAVNTHYSNPAGFHSADMLTTLYDQALICAAAADNSLLCKISSLVTHTTESEENGKKRTFTNPNLLLDPNHWLGHYTPNTRGLNVGSTNEAGWCMATVFSDDGLTDIIIVSGGRNEILHTGGEYIFNYYYLEDVKNLINYARDSFGFVKILDSQKPMFDVDISLAVDRDKLILQTEKEIVALLPENIDVENEITFKTILNKDTFEAPVKEGDVFGTAEAYYQGELLGSVNITAATGVKRSLRLFVFDRISKFFSNDTVQSILCFLLSASFAVGTGFFIRTCINKRKHRMMLRRARRSMHIHAKR